MVGDGGSRQGEKTYICRIGKLIFYCNGTLRSATDLSVRTKE